MATRGKPLSKLRAVGKVARDAGLVAPGFRLLANAGPDAHQTVGHLHVHLFAGRKLGPMLVDPRTVDAMLARGDAIG